MVSNTSGVSRRASRRGPYGLDSFGARSGISDETLGGCVSGRVGWPAEVLSGGSRAEAAQQLKTG